MSNSIRIRNCGEGSIEEQTTRTTFRYMKARVGLLALPYAALPIMKLADEPELKDHSILCKLMRTQAGRDFIAGRG